MRRTQAPTSQALRAEGYRLPYERVSERVRSWVAAKLGSPVVDALTRLGGMSPGCAVRLTTADGQRVFLKAVGAELNEHTPDLFRHEATILAALPEVPCRATLRAAYDDGTWVGLLLDYIDGRPPDLQAGRDIAAVIEAVRTQSAELTPVPAGVAVASIGERAHVWTTRWRFLLQHARQDLPDWVLDDAPALLHRADSLPPRLAGGSLCHWDVRENNLLAQPDGQIVVVDWGQSRQGPIWLDDVSLGLNWAATSHLDTWLTNIVDTHRSTNPLLDTELLADLLISFAANQAWQANRPNPLGLPNFNAFCAASSAAIFITSRRLLSA